MGISIEQILEMIEDLQAAVDYWKQCQPHKVPSFLSDKIQELKTYVEDSK